MDAVICSAVLHFADDEAHFGRMLQEMWRLVAPDGLLFARLASNIGLESRIGPRRGGVCVCPTARSASWWTKQMLIDWTGRLGGQLLDPIKTTNVQQQRCMTTWCVRK